MLVPLPPLRLLIVALTTAVVCVVSPWMTASAVERRVKLGRVNAPGIDLGLEMRVSPTAIAGRQRAQAAGLDGMTMLPGRVLVKFAPGATEHARATARAAVAGQAAPALAWGDFDVVAIDPGADPEEAARRLGARPEVIYAQPDYVAIPHFRPNDPLYADQWNFPAMRMEQAWDINPGSSASVIVAIIDSGVAFDDAVFEFRTTSFLYEGRVFPSLGTIVVPFAAAPDLVGANRVVAPRDFIWEDQDPLDLSGHGTHVAGTLGQLTNNSVGTAGMAFNVRIMPVKVIAEQWDLIFDAPNVGTSAIVAAGIRYAVDNGAKVLNMSLGFPPTSSIPAIEDALRYAVGRGAFVAVSAGNDFEDGNPVEPLAEIAARLDGVLSVGAVGRDLQRAYYSSRRPSVEIAAPGGNFRVGGTPGGILQQTLDPDLSVADPLDRPVSQYRAPRFDVFRYVHYQGTSMSAPHVAGFAAMLMQQGLENPAAIEAAIKRFATDAGADGRDDDFGFGLLNPRETLRGLGLAR